MVNGNTRYPTTQRRRRTAIGALRRSRLPLEVRSNIYRRLGMLGTTRNQNRQRFSNRVVRSIPRTDQWRSIIMRRYRRRTGR